MPSFRPPIGVEGRLQPQPNVFGPRWIPAFAVMTNRAMDIAPSIELIGPHLAWRDKGIAGFVPPNSVLVIEIWLRGVLRTARV